MRSGSSATHGSVLPPRRSARPAVRRARAARARGILNIVVMTFAMGLVATIAIPSYAFNPVAASQPAYAAAGPEQSKVDPAQTVEVPADAAQTAATRDDYTATSMDEILASRAAAEAARRAEELRAQLAAQYNSYSGPTAADYVAGSAGAPIGGVYETSRQYLGVPYVFGGATPSGFDCSGLTMFVYAQFGISLPHSVRGQSTMGTRIPAAEARPGDLVFLNDLSHNGIYAGNGNILHAPYPGASVREQPLWTSSVFYVRLG